MRFLFLNILCLPRGGGGVRKLQLQDSLGGFVISGWLLRFLDVYLVPSDFAAG